MSRTSSQLGSGVLGSFGLGSAGPLGAQRARIDTFTASNTAPVAPGTSITLTWTTDFATTVSIDQGIGVVGANSSIVVNPAVTTVYALTATDGVNPPQIRSVTVTVAQTATFVRSAQGSSTGQIISCSMQLDLGDLVVVEIGSSQTPDGALFGVVDNLGNLYSTAIQGHQLPPDSALPNDALIAWTIVTHPGAAVIEADYLSNFSRIIFAQQYRVPPGMTLAQTAHQIGGKTVSPSYFIANALGTAPYNVTNSVVISFFKQGGFGFNYTSLDGDTLRGCDPGCDNGGAGTVGGAVFEAITVTPGIRNSNVKMDPIAVGQPSCQGNRVDCHGNPWPTGPFYGFGGFMNMLVAVFSAPLPRAATVIDQAAVRPGLSGTISGYAGQPDVTVSLPFMPLVGSLLLVGGETGYTSGPLPVITASDAYGNSYISLRTYNSVTFQASAMLYAVVAHLPTTGVFSVTVNFSIFNGQKIASIAEHVVNSLNPATIQTAVQTSASVGPGVQTLFTSAFAVAVRSLISGFAAAEQGTGTNTPWSASGGFGLDSSWGEGQVDASPAANAPDQSIGDWFHQYVPNAGTYQGQTTVDFTPVSPTGLSNQAIIVAYVPAPAAGSILTLACPTGGGTATVGVFYSAQLIASGGVPPYHNYHLVLGSGPLPPGLTLNPNTGVISGIPTTPGFYPYTAEVTDSVGTDAVISCNITVVQPIPTSGTRFRLEKVMATLKPAPHLPTRGSVK